MDKISNEMLRMKETGKIDGLVGAKNIGMIIDSHNKNIDVMKEKKYNDDIHDRNLYYYKLWQRAVDSIRSGEKPEGKKEWTKKIFLPPNVASNKLVVPTKDKLIVV